MQIIKLDTGYYQILTTVTKTAPDGSTYETTSVEVIALEELQKQSANLTALLVTINHKITAIQALPDDQPSM